MSDDSALLVLHNENFVQNHKRSFNNFLQSEELSDVTLACQGHFMMAHRVVLAASSTFFSEMFKLCNSKHLTVVLNDVTLQEMQSILQFIYTGQCQIIQDEVISFLKVADSLKIEGLYSSNKDNHEGSSCPEKSMGSPVVAARSTKTSANIVIVSGDPKMQKKMVEKVVIRNMKKERPEPVDDVQPIEEETFCTDNIPPNTQGDDDTVSEKRSLPGRAVKTKKLKRNGSRHATSESSTAGKKRTRERSCDSGELSDDSLERQILASPPLDQKLLDEIPNVSMPSSLDDAGPSTSQDDDATRQNLLFVCRKMIMLEKKLKELVPNEKKTHAALKVPLPCTDAKSVFRLEDLLQKDQAQYEILVNNLSGLISTTARLTNQVNTRLKYIFGDHAAVEFCMNGSPTKFEFKNMKICLAVVESVNLVNGGNIDVNYTIKDIGTWFSQALKRLQSKTKTKMSEESGIKKRKIRQFLRVEDMETSHSSEEESE